MSRAQCYLTDIVTVSCSCFKYVTVYFIMLSSLTKMNHSVLITLVKHEQLYLVSE